MRAAIAGGRVLVERAAPRGTRLVLLGAGGRRVLDRVPRRQAIAGFDLAGDRSVWSVGRVSGVQRIQLQRL